MLGSRKTIVPVFKNNKAFRKKILGIDCDPARTAAGRDLLLSYGFDVVIATTLRGALAACAVNHLAIIVVGSSVPETLTQALRTRQLKAGGPPVLCLSASTLDRSPKLLGPWECDLPTQDLRRVLGL
jgi:hypothetical protein